MVVRTCHIDCDDAPASTGPISSCTQRDGFHSGREPPPVSQRPGGSVATVAAAAVVSGSAAVSVMR